MRSMLAELQEALDAADLTLVDHVFPEACVTSGDGHSGSVRVWFKENCAACTILLHATANQRPVDLSRNTKTGSIVTLSRAINERILRYALPLPLVPEVAA